LPKKEPIEGAQKTEHVNRNIIYEHKNDGKEIKTIINRKLFKGDMRRVGRR
jgi:hypothetical protein